MNKKEVIQSPEKKFGFTELKIAEGSYECHISVKDNKFNETLKILGIDYNYIIIASTSEKAKEKANQVISRLENPAVQKEILESVEQIKKLKEQSEKQIREIKEQSEKQTREIEEKARSVIYSE